jgi:Fe-S-cluster containining protein
VDALAAVYAKIPPLNCQGKCSYSCYQSIAFLDEEYERIAKRIGRPIPAREAPGPCPLLSFLGTCSVHDDRPLICRIWGVTQATSCKYGCEPIDGQRLTDMQIAELFAEAAEATGDAEAANLRVLVGQLRSNPEAREVFSAMLRGEHSPELAARARAVRRQIRRRA